MFQPMSLWEQRLAEELFRTEPLEKVTFGLLNRIRKFVGECDKTRMTIFWVSNGLIIIHENNIYFAGMQRSQRRVGSKTQREDGVFYGSDEAYNYQGRTFYKGENHLQTRWPPQLAICRVVIAFH